MSTSIGPSYDPATTAAALAESYTAGRQSILTARTRQASAVAGALTQLRSAISAYQGSLATLSSSKRLLVNAASLSDPTMGTATAGPSATPGSYSFFVERVATASQVSKGASEGSTSGKTGRKMRSMA